MAVHLQLLDLRLHPRRRANAATHRDTHADGNAATHRDTHADVPTPRPTAIYSYAGANGAPPGIYSYADASTHTHSATGPRSPGR